MIGSKNHAFLVGDGDGSIDGDVAPGQAAELEAFFRQDFQARSIPLVERPLGWRSDHVPFVWAGIGVATLSTGSDGLKTQAQHELFGGTLGEPYDPCYHQGCDDLANVNIATMETVTKSIARAAQHFGIDGRGLGR